MNQQTLFRDTIFALSSGGLPSGVAVIRLSGPHARDVLSRLAGGVTPPRQARLRLIATQDGEPLDHGLVLFFPGPASFTGEDCAELHVHGGKATVAAILTALACMPELRQAEAGEFTRRAFLNGKVDLTGAEALADLIAAETETQRRLAFDNAQGRQRDLYTGWRRRLLHARAMIEAELDFADEADVPGSVSASVWADIHALSQDIVNHIDGFRTAEIIRDGFRVALVGAPNAGKSSLLNALAQRDVAIVTDVAGTTRDLVEVALDLDGVKVLVSDTAGLRRTDDIVERIGVERALKAASAADLVLELIDPDGSPSQFLSPNAQVLRIRSKSDLGGHVEGFAHRVSVHSGEGVAELTRTIADLARAAAQATSAIPARKRHVELLRAGLDHLERTSAGEHLGLELRAEELRLASDAIGRIIGTIEVEELLGAIFSEFCIGK